MPLMDFIRRQLFLPGRAPSWWLLGPCFVAAVAWFGLFLVVASLPLNHRAEEDPRGVLLCFVSIPPLMLFLVIALRLAHDWRTRRMRLAGRRLGLRAIGRLGSKDLESYHLASFFHFCGPSNASAGPALEGEFDGVPVRVFDLGFRAAFTRDFSHLTKLCRQVQTVAVVPA